MNDVYYITAITALAGAIVWLARLFLKIIDKGEENVKEMIGVIKDNTHAMRDMNETVNEIHNFIRGRTL